MKDQKAYDRLVSARIALLLDHYFWGNLAMYLQLKEDYAVPTLAVDGKHIFYNPDFIHTLNADLVKSAFVHEIGHCMLEHFVRRGGRDPRLWNVAGDYVINLILKDSGFVIGKGWLLDVAYRDMSTEHVYDRLMQQMQQQQQQKKAGQGQGQGQGQNQGSQSQGQGQGQGQPQGQDPSDLQPLDEVRDGAQSAGEAAEQSLQWQVAVQQAAQGAKEHGKLPGALERFLKSVEPPRVPWREVLQRFITEVNKADYSWMRPNKKMLGHGYYLPSLHSTSMGILVPVLDSSGSIDMTVASAFDAEVRAAWNAARPQRMVTLHCDAKVQHVEEHEIGEELQPIEKLHGGGGTDFRPPFRWLEQEGIKPACLIYLTDGIGPFPEQEPDFPVLWCITTDKVAPWGETVHVRI